MTATNDIAKRREDIRALIASADFEQALKNLLDFARDFSPSNSADLDEAVVISGNFHEMAARRLNYRARRDERTRLLTQALKLLNSIVVSQGPLAA